MNRVILIASLVLISTNCISQGWIWAYSHFADSTMGGYAAECMLSADKNGHLYQVFKNRFTKYTANGAIVWNKTLGLNVYITEVEVDHNNDIVVIGSFSGTVVFGSYTATALGSKDLFISKFDPAGNVIWLVTGGSKKKDNLTDIIIDLQNNINVVGSYDDTLVFLNTTHMPSNNYGSTPLIVKLNSNGGLNFIKTGKKFGSADKIKTDTLGNLYVLGTFGNSMQFDNDSVTGTSPGNNEFLYKLTATGKNTWIYFLGPVNIYSTFDELNSDLNPDIYLFLVNGLQPGLYKFDSTGKYLWKKQLGQTSQIYFTSAWASGKTLYYAGFTGNQYQICGILNKTGMFVSKSDTSGTCHMAEYASTTNIVEPNDLVVYANGDIYVSGWFADTATFGGYLTLTGKKETPYNTFLAKLSLIKPTGIKDQDVDSGITFYPNPASSRVTVDLVNFSEGFNTVNVSVFDIYGKQLEWRAENKKQIQLDFENKPPGMYLITAETDSGIRISKKIIKE